MPFPSAPLLVVAARACSMRACRRCRRRREYPLLLRNAHLTKNRAAGQTQARTVQRPGIQAGTRPNRPCAQTVRCTYPRARDASQSSLLANAAIANAQGKPHQHLASLSHTTPPPLHAGRRRPQQHCTPAAAHAWAAKWAAAPRVESQACAAGWPAAAACGSSRSSSGPHAPMEARQKRTLAAALSLAAAQQAGRSARDHARAREPLTRTLCAAWGEPGRQAHNRVSRSVHKPTHPIRDGKKRRVAASEAPRRAATRQPSAAHTAMRQQARSTQPAVPQLQTQAGSTLALWHMYYSRHTDTPAPRARCAADTAKPLRHTHTHAPTTHPPPARRGNNNNSAVSGAAPTHPLFCAARPQDDPPSSPRAHARMQHAHAPLARSLT